MTTPRGVLVKKILIHVEKTLKLLPHSHVLVICEKEEKLSYVLTWGRREVIL
jgi:hypothetical protein